MKKKLEFNTENTIPITKFFDIDIPDYTKKDVIKSMNKGTNYYERLDFELAAWDCIAHVVHKTLTLQQFLEIVYDKYDLLTLSFILRKSKAQIINKLKELGLKKEEKYDDSKELSLISESLIKFTNKKLAISLMQTDNKEIEKWFMENNNYQGNSQYKLIDDILIKDTIQYYLKNKNHVMLFKFLIIYMNFMKIPYKIDTDGNEVFLVIEFNPNYIRISNEKLEIMNKIKSYKLIRE